MMAPSRFVTQAPPEDVPQAGEESGELHSQKQNSPAAPYFMLSKVGR